MIKRNYTQEFKKEAARLVIEHGYTQAEASRSLGVPDKNISRWVREFQSPIVKAQPTNEQAELDRLRKENQQLKLEREILKKAAAFFASEQK